DWYAQVMAYTEEFLQALGGRSTLGFSWNALGGTEMSGIYSFVIFSPFNIIFLIFGAGAVQYTLPIVMLCKLLCIGIVGLWFIKKYFPALTHWQSITMALLYTFCSYFFHSQTYPLWVDLLIYIPLLFDAFKQMINKNCVWKFGLIGALCIASSFYVGSETLLFSSLFLFAYIFICLPKEERGRVSLRLVSGYAIAFFSTLFITMPALLQFMGSGRNESQIAKLLTINPILEMAEEKLLYLLPDIVSIVLCIVFLVKCDKKNKLNNFFMVAFVLVCLPLVFQIVNYAFNLTIIYGYPNRLGSIYSFVFMCIACEGLRHVNDKAQYAPQKRYSTKIILFEIIFGSILVLAFRLCPADALLGANTTFNVNMANVAIMAGLYLFIVLGLIMNIKYCISGRISRKKFVSIFVTIGIIIASTSSILFSSENTLKVKDFDQISHFTQTIQDDQYSRVKYWNVDVSTCDQHVRGTTAFSGFISMIDNSAVEYSRLLGYELTPNSMSTTNGTLFSDSLSGVKYVISFSPLNRPYLNLIDVTKDSYLYEYTLSFGDAYMIKSVPEYDLTENTFINQNAIYKTMSADNYDIFSKLDSGYFSTTEVDSKPAIQFNYTASENELLYIHMNSAKEYDMKLNKYHLTPEINTYNWNNMEICYLTAGQSVSYTIANSDLGMTIADFDIYSLDYDRYADFADTIVNQDISYTYTNDSMTIQYNNTDSYNYVVTTHPNIKGYTAGENKIISALSCVAFEINSGENTINIKYGYPYVKIIIICLIVGILISIGIVLLNNKRLKKLENATYYVYIAFSLIQLTMCVLVPLLYDVYWLIFL
ncbi:MAG: YfhO family protein, partial [Clostridia bacterium]